jgi:hypothetical protein
MPLDPQPWYEKLGSASATRAPGGLLAGLLLGIDHIGICVGDMTAAGAGWAGLLGVPLTDREDVAAQKTAAGFLRMPQGAAAVDELDGGGGGHLVAFLHPRALGGTLVELVERKGDHR